MKRKIILDTDPALGERIGLNIDDDLAIMFLLNSPEVEIIGITTTYGNSTRDRTYRDARRLLMRAGRPDIPVIKGAGWMSRELGRETDASRFIRETIMARQGELTMVTLGPLTNLAAALHSAPSLLCHAQELVMMGGRLKSGLTEFNFSAHPEATAKVLAVSCPKFIATLDLCFQVVFTAEHLRRWEGNPNLVIAPWLGATRRWLRLNRMVMGALSLRHKEIPTGGFFPWDGIAVSYLVKPELFAFIRHRLMTMDGNKVILEDPISDDDPRAVRLPEKVSASSFMKLFLERIGSLTVTGPNLLSRRSSNHE